MFAQLALYRVELVAVVDRRMRSQSTHTLVLGGFVGDDDDSGDSLGFELPGELRDAQAAIDWLAAGHRDGIVVEDLVGDRDAGGDRLADRQQPGVEVGAVAKVGEDVFDVGEWRLADPGDAFAAHVGEGCRAAVHPGDHVMAADAGDGLEEEDSCRIDESALEHSSAGARMGRDLLRPEGFGRAQAHRPLISGKSPSYCSALDQSSTA
ncbi:MAG: hypothetical protein CAPSK01_003142 [Candidatus Accumulibacter vicinus]|uniref:Uncharacterized protein n=2 Tax=Candidatus Accumulibacter vicinus TaxID=2954382 RepID=A0A084XY40_9PROT|nr:MAG: hypothetical protein CAPSK01_003142 [Candidatus Accumulibacter vicinus]